MKNLFTAVFILAAFIVKAQQQAIPLYNGAAPGSEKWNWEEKTIEKNLWGTPVLYNVTHPSLLVYTPSPEVNSGTAVIICPGGGFQALSIKSEGTDVALALQQKGITAFVLKYRVMHTLTDDPTKEQRDKPAKQTQDDQKAIYPFAVADTREAIAYVRKHAAEYGVSPSRIVIIGFSAGGVLVTSAATTYTPETRPDYAASIYGGSSSIQLPADAPPMFVAVAANDHFGLAPSSVDLYNKWVAAKYPVELHIYEKGDHGFGMKRQNIPTDTWIDRFTDWMDLHGLLNPIDPKAISVKDKAERDRKNTQFFEDMFHKDWPNLNRYAAANEKVPPPAPGEKRVVFMGNSITDSWIVIDSGFFAGKPYYDRGISGQTTPQMLVRFREDVINLKPSVVVILAGINDIAENTGPNKLKNVFGNIRSMVELAHAAGIKAVISSVLPANHFPWRPSITPTEKVIQLNKMLKEYADQTGVVYLDYYSKMVDSEKGLPKKYSNDGVHPTLDGYRVMEPLVEKAIAEALKRDK